MELKRAFPRVKIVLLGNFLKNGEKKAHPGHSEAAGGKINSPGEEKTPGK